MQNSQPHSAIRSNPEDLPGLSEVGVALCMSNTILRESIREALERPGDIRIVADTGTPTDMRAILTSEEPNIVIVSSTVVHSLLASEEFQCSPSLRILAIVGVGREAAVMERLFRAGCTAVVTTDIAMADLVSVVRLVAHGMAVLAFGQDSSQKLGVPLTLLSTSLPRLSPREVSLLQLLADGHSESETARDLGIGLRTCQTYLERIRLKLGARNRQHAVAMAAAAGAILPQALREVPVETAPR